jgi:hypothetical protein
MLLSLDMGLDMDMGMSIMMITTMSTAGMHLTIRLIQAISPTLNHMLNRTFSLVYRLR